MYNLETNSLIKKLSYTSTFSIGTQCPYLFLSNETPTYIKSKNNKNVKVINIQNDTQTIK